MRRARAVAVVAAVASWRANASLHAPLRPAGPKAQAANHRPAIGAEMAGQSEQGLHQPDPEPTTKPRDPNMSSATENHREINVLLPAASWERVEDEFRALEGISPLLLDDAAKLVNGDGKADNGPIHAAWHNFELPRRVVRDFAGLLLGSETLEFVPHLRYARVSPPAGYRIVHDQHAAFVRWAE